MSEGQNYLYLELINESPYNGGLVATGTASLNQVFNQGTESQWVSLRSTSGQPFGELSLRLSFNVRKISCSRKKKKNRFIDGGS